MHDIEHFEHATATPFFRLACAKRLRGLVDHAFASRSPQSLGSPRGGRGPPRGALPP